MSTSYLSLIERLKRVAGETGISVDDARLKDIFNIVSETLFSQGGMPWNYALVNLSVYDDRVALPPMFGAVVGVAKDFKPISLANRWYEFSKSGPGPQLSEACRKWTNTLIDRGYSPVARQPSEGSAFVLRVYPQIDERVSGVAPSIRVTGFNEDGSWIRSQIGGLWVDGVDIELPSMVGADIFAVSSVKFSRIASISKPITRKDLTLAWYDADADIELAAGDLAYNEEISNIRVYSLPSATTAVENQIQLLVHTNFRPIVEDTDVPQVDFFPALRYGFLAVAKEEAGDIDNAAKWWTLATNALSRYLTQYQPVIHAGTLEFNDAAASARRL